MKRLLLILFICLPLYGANDFSSDANCVALWRFENGALTTDSKGTNTLTPSASAPTADTTNFKEGTGSVDFEEASVQSYSITDASLSTGFPFKNGDTNKKISICFWIKPESFQSGESYIFDKGVGTSVRSFKVSTGADDIRVGIGNGSGALWENLDHGTAMSTGQWYHVGITFQDSDKSYKIRIWDDTASALLGGTEVTGTSTNNINVENGGLSLSFNDGGFAWDGLIDEMVVFNDILSSGEIDQIRTGTYGASTPPASKKGQTFVITSF